MCCWGYLLSFSGFFELEVRVWVIWILIEVRGLLDAPIGLTYLKGFYALLQRCFLIIEKRTKINQEMGNAGIFPGRCYLIPAREITPEELIRLRLWLTSVLLRIYQLDG
ncbi:hypothetical protein E2542_SST13959 [Spatholobus suberectus]|nr:hypothetical protein E2542_SST13959 [Spatholobus suberectus]